MPVPTSAGGNGQAPTQPAAPAANGQAPTPALTDKTGGSPTAGQNGQAPTAIPPQSSDDDASAALPSTEDWKRIQQELAESRRESARYRNELKTRDDALLTAEEKRARDYSDLQTRAAEQELRLQRLSLENAGYRLGASLGIGDLAAALAILQVEHAADLRFTEDGSPENLDELMRSVLERHPILAAQPSAAGSNAANQQQSTGGRPLAPQAPLTGATNPPRAGQVAGASGIFNATEIPRLTDPRLWRKS